MDLNFNITKELVALFSMKNTTKSCNIFNVLKSKYSYYEIKLNNLFGVITNEAPSIV